jgi:hypothetical protein
VSAEEWLNGAVQRALTVGDPARYPELVGAVEALAGCGAVSDEVARAARRRLDEAFDRAPVAAPRDARPCGGGAARSEERLAAVLCPPGPPGSGLLRLPLRLGDDVGTAYAVRGGQASGEPPWRAEHRFEPGVPRSASRLTVAVERADAVDGELVELELPSDR